MTLLNKDVFAVDPTGRTLPNDGVTALDQPETKAEWGVLKYELQQFVAEGEYREGLRRVLNSYLTNVDKQTQPAVWVSGFYGSGKSHFLRVLATLWTNPTIDGVSARSLVNCPEEVRELLKEIDSFAKRDRTTTFAAAGVLRRGNNTSIAQPLLEILLGAAGLPTQYGAAKFALWLREDGLWHAFATALQNRNKTIEEVSRNLFVSTAVREALLEVRPGWANSVAEAGESLKANYQIKDISDDMVVDTIRQVLEMVAKESDYGDKATVPLTLLVIDELQQYLSDDVQLLLEMQNMVERLTKQFQGRLLVVAAGQSALTANEMLARFQDRFTVQVQLQSKDVETVVRQVVLRKNQIRVPELSEALSKVSGEIARHLAGSKLAARPADNPDLVADYPLLPTRRRFMETALRAVDRGAAGQLRSQLRVTLEAVSDIAQDPVGTVVPGDVVYASKREDMLNQGVLLHDLADRIAAVRDGSDNGDTRARAAELIYLISQLDDGDGILPNTDMLADLMVMDLNAGSAALRAALPDLLEPMVGSLLVLDNNEYRLQSPTDAEWNLAFNQKRQSYLINTSEQVHARDDAIRRRLEQELAVVNVSQGDTNTNRKWVTQYGEAVPTDSASELVLWVRSGWDTTETMVRTTVGQLGMDSPTVTLLLPKIRDQDFKAAIADWRAAATVTSTQPPPTTEEGVRARDAMESRAKRAEEKVNGYAADVLAGAQIYLGGGDALFAGSSLQTAVREALGKAAVRKFFKFKQADHAGWQLVFKRAKEGNAAALDAVGHKTDATAQPVVKEIKAFIGNGAHSGASIHKHYSAEPFGWPKDAINGALAVLVQSDDVSASDGATPYVASKLTEPVMAKLNYQGESIVLTFAQRQALKKLASKLELPMNPVDVASCITTLKNIAGAAGGPSPAPLPPPTADLDILRAKFGVERQAAVADQVDDLLSRKAEWESAANVTAARMVRWQEAQRLVYYARSLPGHAELESALSAIDAQRSLLTEPDPVTPIVATLRDHLRTAMQAAHDEAAHAHRAALDEVEAQPQWTQLSDEERAALLNECEFAEPTPPEIDDDTKLLDSLDRRSLRARREQAAAFAGRAKVVIQKLVEAVTPEALSVRPPPALLASVTEADAYLSALRSAIMSGIDAGRSVSITT